MRALVTERRLSSTAEPSVLDGVHALLEELWLAEPGVGGSDRAAFATAVAEVTANVVEHAGPGGPLQVVLRVAGGALVAELEDEGRAFDGLSPGPADPQDERGRGLAMARALSDEVGYERVGDVNRWRLSRRYAPEGP